MRNRTIFSLVALCFAAPGLAYPAQSAAVPPEPARATTATPTREGPSAADAATHAILRQVLSQQAQQTREAALTAQALNDQLVALRPSYADKLVTGLVAIVSAFLGAGIGALSGFFLQRERLKHDRQAARQAAGMKEVSEIKQFRSRQLNEFYAPLEALLKQGLIVRNELYSRLKATTQTDIAFSELRDPDATNGWSLGIAEGAADPRPFRLLDDLPLLQTKFPDVMSTVGETVRINQLIVKLIHDKIGLALNGSDELSQQLGTFLAHQSVLEDMYTTVKTGKITVVPKYTTTFPRRLQKLVSDDCQTLRTELKAWEVQVAAWIKDIGGADGATT